MKERYYRVAFDTRQLGDLPGYIVGKELDRGWEIPAAMYWKYLEAERAYLSAYHAIASQRPSRKPIPPTPTIAG